VELEAAATELYGLPPGEFTARRTKLAGQARAEGDAEAAKAIAALRRPTVSAWLVNQLVRGAGEADVDALEQLGIDLREAQAQLDGARMKQLTQQRQRVVAALVKRAGALQSVSSAVERELEETFGAAVADEQAASAVFSGQLTRALVYSGFGEVDVADSTAMPVTAAKRAPAPKKKPEAKKKPGPADESAAEAAREARVEAAKEDLEAARADLAEVQQDVGTSRDDLEEARSREQELSTRLDELQREILEVRRELDSASRSVATAERLHQRAGRHATEAEKSVARAEAALARLTPG
jgi:archaellum component FlaC